MTMYTVHSRVTANESQEDQLLSTVFIAESKPLLAPIFPFVWLLWMRLWWPALFYLLILIILTTALNTEFVAVSIVINFVPGLFLFLEGNELRRKALHRKGYDIVAIVAGDDLIAAETRYFHGQFAGDQQQNAGSTGQSRHAPPRTVKVREFWSQNTGLDFLAGSENQ